MSVHNMQGCSDKRCRRWEIRWREKRGSGYKNRSKAFHGTQREAKAEEARLKAEGSRPEIERIDGPLSEIGERWAKKRVEAGKVTDVTGAKNIRHIKRIMREIGDPNVSNITPSLLTEAYSTMEAAPETVHNINATLKTMFRDLRISPNPCDEVELPRLVRRRKKTLEADGLRAVSSICDPSSPCSYAVALCAQTGMRRGEVCALTYADIDMDDRIIRVHASIDRFGHRKSTKTEASMRDLPLTDGALRTVEGAMRASVARGIAISSSTPIIPPKSGCWIDPHAVTRWWDRNREKLGFPGITIHALRHSYLSELARRGIPPKSLQALAGHSNISTTMDIYAHANLDDKRAAVESVDW